MHGPQRSREGMSPETWKQEGRVPRTAAAGGTGRACDEENPHITGGVSLCRIAVGCDRAIMGSSGKGKLQYCFHCTPS